jgi:hypothetical protein
LKETATEAFWLELNRLWSSAEVAVDLHSGIRSVSCPVLANRVLYMGCDSCHAVCFFMRMFAMMFEQNNNPVEKKENIFVQVKMLHKRSFSCRIRQEKLLLWSIFT